MTGACRSSQVGVAAAGEEWQAVGIFHWTLQPRAHGALCLAWMDADSQLCVFSCSPLFRGPTVSHCKGGIRKQMVYWNGRGSNPSDQSTYEKQLRIWRDCWSSGPWGFCYLHTQDGIWTQHWEKLRWRVVNGLKFSLLRTAEWGLRETIKLRYRQIKEIDFLGPNFVKWVLWLLPKKHGGLVGNRQESPVGRLSCWGVHSNAPSDGMHWLVVHTRGPIRTLC